MIRSTILLLVSLLAAAPAAADIILDVDFEGQPLDQVIGTGGAAAGQPYDIYNCTPIVRDGPMGSYCLEIEDIADFGTGNVLFAFLDDAEIVTGTVEIVCDLWFDYLELYHFYVREQGSSGQEFLTAYFLDGGAVAFHDQSGFAGSATYEVGRSIRLRVLYDIDAGTYDLWWDGTRVITDRAHGIVGRGVGSIIVGTDHDEDLDGLFYIDDLRVETDVSTPTTATDWGSLKLLWK